MLRALLVVWVAVIPIAILLSAWANARGAARATGQGMGAPAAPGYTLARQWVQVAGLLGISRSQMGLSPFQTATAAVRFDQPAAGDWSARGARRAAARPEAAFPPAQTQPLRRECAGQRLRGRGDAGHTERS